MAEKIINLIIKGIHMKNKIFVISILLFLAIFYILRVISVNSNTLGSEEMKYRIGDEVLIENDFFDSSSEKMNGYSVTVTDINILSIDEFKSEYGEFENEMHAEYIYLVKTTFKNENNKLGEKAGIDLGQYILQENSYINFINREAYKLTNEIDSLTFSLRENSEMEFVIPFTIDSMYINIEKLKSGDPTLIVSLYPHKKIIELIN